MNTINRRTSLHKVAAFACISLALLAPMKSVFADDMKHGVSQPDKLAWGLFDPKQPKGVQITVLFGDPSKSGPFALRLKVPAGLDLGSHTHSNPEFVTVISGKAKISWGVKSDVMAGDDLMPGTFFWMSGGDHHDFKAIDETVVELHSMGPFDMIADK